MSYICYKLISGKKYAYEVTSIWDPKNKKVKKKNKYLGIVSDDGIVKKKRFVQDNKLNVLDFGNVHLVYEFLRKTSFYTLLIDTFGARCPEITQMIIYKICCQSAMYNASIWYEGNILPVLMENLKLTSQNISRTLEYLGSENIQHEFFSKYLKNISNKKNNIIIDATSLPNQSSHYFNLWGRCDGHVEKQFKFLCVVNQETKDPLYYRFLPGNLVDIKTLQNTIAELRLLGAKNNFVLLDAGYESEENIKELYLNKIDFLTRLPSNRKIYRNIIETELHDLEKVENGIKYGNRVLFVKHLKCDLYGKKGNIYIVLDPAKKSVDVNKVISEYLDNKYEKLEDNNNIKSDQIIGSLKADDTLNFKFKKAGVMMFISSKNIDRLEVISTYYIRQIIEQVFGFFKSDLDSLPIRNHNDSTIRGYLFLQFLVLIIYIKIRSKVQDICTVEQALIMTRNLKCQVFDKEILVNELTKQQSEIYKACGVMVPKNLGI